MDFFLFTSVIVLSTDSCQIYISKIFLLKVIARTYHIFQCKENFHKEHFNTFNKNTQNLLLFFSYPSISPPCLIYIPLSMDFEFFINFEHPFSDITIYLLTFTIFVSHKSVILHDFIIHSTLFHHQYLWVYISAKNGSVAPPLYTQSKNLKWYHKFYGYIWPY